MRADILRESLLVDFDRGHKFGKETLDETHSLLSEGQIDQNFK